MHFGDIEVRFLDAACSAWTAMPCSASSPRCSGKRSLPRTNKTRIRMRANSLLVRAHGKNIIVETGNGTKWDSKLRGIYAVQDGDPLIDSLGRSGVAPSEIDLVINTHLHFDHCGGNTRIEGNQPVPAFPSATYIVQSGELGHARQPTERDRASYFPENFEPIARRERWNLVAGDCEILPGISVSRIPGHNADIQAVTITGGGKTLAFVADLLPTRHHISLPWIMAYDLYPVQTLETKRNWLSRMVVDGAIVVFGHDPNIPVATLHQRGDQIEISPVDLNR